MERYNIDAASQHPPAWTIFDKFSTFRAEYKIIDGQPIHAFFVVPNKLPSGPRPLLVRFHGGGWVEGEAETDIRSFRRWIEDGSAQQLLNTPLPDVVIDTGNLLVGGDSIGGHIAVTTALLPLTSLPIRVLFLQYPALDMTDVTRTENISEAMQRSTVGAESVPYCEVEDYLANHEKGAVRSRAIFGSRMRLLMGMLQAGKFWDAERDAERLCPMQVLKEGAAKLPPILLYHSQEDEILPRQQTEEWAAKLRRLLPDVPLFLTSQQGDHIFD